MATLGPFYTGQIPADDLTVTVKDAVSNSAKSLSSYSGAELVLVGPDGTQISTSDGSCTISDSANGVVSYAWPTTSLFDDVGDYKFQIKLTNTNVEDYTQPKTFEVKSKVA